MTGADVLSIVGSLTEAGIKVWLDGGWGVDALIGRQTRPHNDLDAVIQLDQADAAVALLTSLGYWISLDDRPTRLVLGDGKERRIDFHPIILDRDGNGRQIGAGPAEAMPSARRRASTVRAALPARR